MLQGAAVAGRDTAPLVTKSANTDIKFPTSVAKQPSADKTFDLISRATGARPASPEWPKTSEACIESRCRLILARLSPPPLHRVGWGWAWWVTLKGRPASQIQPLLK